MKAFLVLFCLLGLVGVSFADDPGKETIGAMKVRILFATDGDVEVAGAGAKELEADEVKNLQAMKELRFQGYRLLGSDRSEILRGYESWATPLRPSKEILVSFEPMKRLEDGKMQIVLEYWQSEKKVFSTNPVLTVGKVFYLLGPEWRGGRIVLALEMEELIE